MLPCYEQLKHVLTTSRLPFPVYSKPRFWNTSWSVVLLQNRGPHFGKKRLKDALVTLFILFLCHKFFVLSDDF